MFNRFCKVRIFQKIKNSLNLNSLISCVEFQHICTRMQRYQLRPHASEKFPFYIRLNFFQGRILLDWLIDDADSSGCTEEQSRHLWNNSAKGGHQSHRFRFHCVSKILVSLCLFLGGHFAARGPPLPEQWSQLFGLESLGQLVVLQASISQFPAIRLSQRPLHTSSSVRPTDVKN